MTGQCRCARLGLTHISLPPGATHPGLVLSGDVDFSPLTYGDEDKTSPAEWLAQHDWAVDPVRGALELQADYGLIPSDVDAQIDAILRSQYVTATR